MSQQFGSLINHLSQRGGVSIQPEVGMGATNLCWTDRHAYTIIEVSKSGKTIKVQADTAIRTDGYGMTDGQSYRFEPNANGAVYTVRLTKRGWRSKEAGAFAIGYRSEYYDFGF